jgi:hypothetical protein
MFQAVVIGLSTSKPGFDLDHIRVIQVVDKMAFGQVVLRVLRFGSVSSTPQMVYDHVCLNAVLIKKASAWNVGTFKQNSVFSKNFHIYFFILLTVHLVIILANNQLDALFHVFIYFTCLHVSSITVFIRRTNCINISSGMICLCKWLFGRPVYRPTKQSLTQTNHTR